MTTLTAVVILWIVGDSQLIPTHAANYLLKTGPTRFSKEVLGDILVREVGDQVLLPWLLLLYWLYFLCITTSMVVLLVLQSRPGRALVRGFSQDSYQAGLMTVAQLRAALRQYVRNRTFRSRARLRRLAMENFFQALSPIRPNWVVYPQYQWMKPEAVRIEERAIIRTLRDFLPALRYEIENGGDLKCFLGPLATLEAFFFKIALRHDSRLERDAEPQGFVSEIELLKQFSAKSRHLVLAFRRKATRPTNRTMKYRDWLIAVFFSQPVKYTSGLSLMAAAVMLIGVGIFRIPGQQAFLTWFTVTFGSLTISVGISAFSFTRDRKRLPMEESGRTQLQRTSSSSIH